MKALICVAVLTTLAARPAHACSCARSSLGAALKQADLVFIGRIAQETRTKVDTPQCKKHPDWCVYRYQYKVTVEGQWKGAVTADVTIDTGTNTGDCSLGKLRSKKYVFFATGTSAQPRVRMCGGTRAATPTVVREMVKAFGAASKP